MANTNIEDTFVMAVVGFDLDMSHLVIHLCS